MTKIISTILIAVFPYFLIAQNLIPNHDFEKYKGHLVHRAESFNAFTNAVEGWWGVTLQGSPDWITKETTWKRRKAIQKNPSNCFAGFGGDPHHFEFIGTKLKRPLQQGKNYKVTFDIAIPATQAQVQLRDDFGFLFTHEEKKETRGHIFEQPQATFEAFSPRPGIWTTITTYFTAEANFQYCYIGEFYPNATNKYWKRTALKYYFFIDNVIIEDIAVIPEEAKKKPTPPPVIASPIVKQIIDTIRLSGVLFEVDKAILSPKAKTILDDHLVVLKKVTQPIEIVGHTDNTGNAEHNLTLSQNRADAVADYLASKGISRSLLLTKGVGSQFPTASNETIKGREQNRRVEVLYKK